MYAGCLAAYLALTPVTDALGEAFSWLPASLSVDSSAVPRTAAGLFWLVLGTVVLNGVVHPVIERCTSAGTCWSGCRSPASAGSC